MTYSDRDAYASLADELNDYGTHHGPPALRMSVDDFDPGMVAAARRYAEANSLNFPPGVGDFDRLWEFEQAARRLTGR